MSAEAAVLTAYIRRELSECVQSLRAGGDIAPARRARLEGAIDAGIDAGLLDADAMLQQVREQLPEDCAIVIARDNEGCRVSLQLWQRRAPVYPSTAD